MYRQNVPALLGVAKFANGTALFVGLDRAQGTPISYCGLIGIGVSGGIIGIAASHGWHSTYRLIQKLAAKIPPEEFLSPQPLPHVYQRK